MAKWTKAIDPLDPPAPRVHDPLRCMNCGHHRDDHDAEVGCLVEGGTKYLENEQKEALRACSCAAYVPVPE